MTEFLSHLALVATQVGVLFALMAVGWIAYRTKILSESAVKGMTELLVLVVTPCLIVQAFQRPFDAGRAGALAATFAVSVAIQALTFAAAGLFTRRASSEARAAVFRFAVVFSNAGFMGLPLEQAILGSEGVFYGAVYVAVFNVLCWTIGLRTMAGSAAGGVSTWRIVLLNPGVLGLAAAMPLFLFSVTLPAPVAQPVKMLADLNTPLAMIVIGWYLASARLGAVLRDAGAWIVSGVRLVIVPAVVFAAFAAVRSFAGAPKEMAVAVLIAAAAPVAALTAVFAARYGRDVSLAAGLVALSTLLSVVTLPPIVSLGLWLF